MEIYVPVEGKEQDTEELYREIQQNMDKIRKTENIILTGDFNGRPRQPTNPSMYRTIWRTSDEPQWSNIEKFLCI